MKLTQTEIQTYVGVAGTLIDAGIAIAGKIGPLVSLFHPQAALTEDEINAIEQAGVADALRRRDERAAMGVPVPGDLV